MYKYNIADGNHLIQEVDIKGGDCPSFSPSSESLQVEYNRIKIKKERLTEMVVLTIGNSEILKT